MKFKPLIAITSIALSIANVAHADVVAAAVQACANAGPDCTAAYLQQADKTDEMFQASEKAFSDMMTGLTKGYASETNWEQGYELYQQGRFDEAMPLLTESCENEIGKACTIMGVIFENYSNQSDRVLAAASAYSAACYYEDIQGCTSFATMIISSSESTHEDYVTAESLLSKACELGDGRGCNNLAVLYDLVIGDDAKPLVTEYYGKACHLGYQKAC